MTENRLFPEISTPALLLARPVLERNLDRIAQRARAGGVQLRPHCKTHKCAEIARLATRGFAGGITVSTLAEAEYFAEHGVSDITYAVGIALEKLPRVEALQRNGARIGVLLDTIEAAEAVANFAATSSHPLRVWIEIDPGYQRGGVLPESERLIQIGRRLSAARGVDLFGVLTHAGHSYSATSTEEIVRIAEDERLSVIRAAESLESAGIECPQRSIGSTPTVACAESFAGVTEVRPGVYTFFDLMMEALGVCTHEDIAISVLATVIGHQREHGHILTDAGAFALSKDTGHERPGHPYGKFGLVRRRDANRPDEDLVVQKVSQEHGWIYRRAPEQPFPFERFPVGSRLRVLPNHACETANCFDRYHVLDANDQLVDVWPRIRGW